MGFVWELFERVSRGFWKEISTVKIGRWVIFWEKKHLMIKGIDLDTTEVEKLLHQLWSIRHEQVKSWRALHLGERERVCVDFIVGRNILHIVLNVQEAMEYAWHIHQELIMVELYLERAYDHSKWSFVSRLMHTMGFGPHISHLIFLLGQDVVSWVMLNGWITLDIASRDL